MSKDFFGNELYEGDVVSYFRRASTPISFGVVAKVYEKTSLVFTLGVGVGYKEVMDEFANSFAVEYGGNKDKFLHDCRIIRKDNRDIVRRLDII